MTACPLVLDMELGSPDLVLPVQSFSVLTQAKVMSPVEVFNPSTPSSASRLLLSASSAAASDSSESSDGDSAPVVPRTRCQRPGRRLIGGRIYDSILGVTCHWCRQKTVEDHVYCCQCTVAFCGGCLKNRHGELIDIEMKEDVNWVCPKCRGGCGHGCTHCCNCGPCRKAQGLEPTGLLVHTARACGFTNVHDYLIHKNTGESQENIAERKRGKGWCQTGQLSPSKKQKIEDDKVERTTSASEGGCRKRLSFSSFDSGRQVNNMSADDKLLLPDALQKTEGNQANMSADKKLLLLCPLQGEEYDHREPKSTAAPSSQKKVTPVHGPANQPNIFAAAFSRSESDALWSRFSSDFKFPPENEEGSASPSTSGNFETHSNVRDARDLAGPSTSEINSDNRSKNPTPIFLGAKKERMDEEQQKTHAVVAKLESMDSQEAQCNIGLLLSMNVEGHQDRMVGPTLSAMSCSHPKNSLLTSTIKEEREDCQSKQWSPLVTKSTTASFSQTSTLWHSVEVKEEREDPQVANASPVHSNNAKNQASLASQVKKEVSVDTQMSNVICIEDDDVDVDVDCPPVNGIQATSIIKKSTSLGAVPQVWIANDFKSQLEAKLSKPFSMRELEILTEAVSHRKPIFKACETRQGCSQFLSQEEEYSCLDHHPDLASQLQSSSSPVYKLSLLRGFFFWLEHARTQGAFKPWTLVSQSSETPDNNDCVEIEGPDCEILAVAPSVDEEAHGANLSRIITV